jgi:DNA-binding MurR/RpiR family transcriptional regulator
MVRSPEAQTRMRDAVAALHMAGRIAIFGIGPSAALATYAAMLLARSGRHMMTLNLTGVMLADQMLALRGGDALVVLAYGRAYREVMAVLAEAQRLGLPVVLVTDSLDARLLRLARVVLTVPRGRAQRIALHGATLVALECLVLGLAAAGRRDAMATLERLNVLRRAVDGRQQDL